MNTILLVENEHAPRAVFGDYLGNEGFTVLEAADAAEALRACDAYSGQVDLLIADRKAGARLASRLAAKYPGMGLLFIGDSEQTTSAPEPPPGCRRGCRRGCRSGYLHKPFTAQMLLKSALGLIDSGAVARRK